MRSDGGGAGVARALGTFGVLSVDSCMRSRSVVSRTDAADPANRLQGPTHRAIISTPRHARRRRHRPTNNRPSLNHVVLYTSIAYRTTWLNHGCLHGQPPLDRTLSTIGGDARHVGGRRLTHRLSSDRDPSRLASHCMARMRHRLEWLITHTHTHTRARARTAHGL